jgi:hypothetical protein
MDNFSSSLIIGLILLIVLWLILRELVCWYYKINERISLQIKTNELLEKLIKINIKSNLGNQEVDSIGQTSKFGDLEVSQRDLLGQMNWGDAEKACSDLGVGWRLPTKDELNVLYQNKDKIGGFVNDNYWSSNQYFNGTAFVQDFNSGKYSDLIKNKECSVRAVKSSV